MMWVAGVAVAGAAVGLGWYGCAAPSSQWLGPSLVRGPLDGKRIALTFDDGPAPPFTEQILDILRARNIRATFFVCGRNVERHPEVLRLPDGHGVRPPDEVDRSRTVQALPRIIDWALGRGFTFVPLKHFLSEQ